MLALRGSYLGSTQLVLISHFQNWSPPIRIYSPDGRRNTTNVFLFIRMAHAIKPMRFCLFGWQTQ